MLILVLLWRVAAQLSRRNAPGLERSPSGHEEEGNGIRNGFREAR